LTGSRFPLEYTVMLAYDQRETEITFSSTTYFLMKCEGKSEEHLY
jgi:hypothetical protein